MKKLKYLLLIIPLLFIFIGNINAIDIYTCGESTITDQTIKTDLQNYYPNNDFTGYDYFSCSLNPNGNYNFRIYCNLFTNDFVQNISYYSSSSNIYTFKSSVDLGGSFKNFYSISYYKNNCSIYSGSISFKGGVLYLSYFYPYNATSSFFYTNFDSEVINNAVGTDLYDYNLAEEPEPEPEEPTIENKIYLPDELEEGNCPIILNKDTIRVYEEEPQANISVNYVDYFINSHYIKQNGVETLTDTITCLSLTDFTTSYVYRFDFDKILIIFIILVVLFSYIIMKIIHAFFIGFKHR